MPRPKKIQTPKIKVVEKHTNEQDANDGSNMNTSDKSHSVAEQLVVPNEFVEQLKIKRKRGVEKEEGIAVKDALLRNCISKSTALPFKKKNWVHSAKGSGTRPWLRLKQIVSQEIASLSGF